MITRLLATLSDTPRYETGMRAYDVRFKTNEGEKSTAVLTRGNEHIGEQIRQVLFANHPEATDYTFRQFDYLDFQYRTFIRNAVESTLGSIAMRDGWDGGEELY